MIDSAWISIGSAAGIVVCAAVGWRRLRGTTLAAAALWMAVSALVAGGVEAWLWQFDDVNFLGASLARYAAACGTFCPLMAVLGAKRPQDRGWQWVVASLWVVMLVPAAQAIALRSGTSLVLAAPWQILLWSLLAMGLLNYLPTRYVVSAAVAVGGQWLLAAGYLAESAPGNVNTRAAGGLALIFAAALIAIASGRRARKENEVGDRFSARWRRFRDAWGAFWGMRILQRVNQSAELAAWPVRLDWGGFTPAGTEIDASTAEQIDQTLDSLLWRFERVAAEAGSAPAPS